MLSNPSAYALWWGWLLETFASNSFHDGVADALARLVRAAEGQVVAR
ncbi:MAG TPA: hypothetical protein VIX58_03945 [Anaerolineae bacterium]